MRYRVTTMTKSGVIYSEAGFTRKDEARMWFEMLVDLLESNDSDPADTEAVNEARFWDSETNRVIDVYQREARAA